MKIFTLITARETFGAVFRQMTRDAEGKKLLSTLKPESRSSFAGSGILLSRTTFRCWNSFVKREFPVLEWRSLGKLFGLEI